MQSPDVKARRSAAGRKAKEAGRSFERAVDVELLTLQQQRFVEWWEHNKAGKVGPIYVEASGADVAGILCNGCVGFAMETKSTGTDKAGRLERFNRSRISMKQEAHLEAVAHAGGPSLLALEFRTPDRGNVSVLIPWRKVAWRGMKSLALNDVLEWVVVDGFGATFRRLCLEAPACRR